jgi:hypothetical protein
VLKPGFDLAVERERREGLIGEQKPQIRAAIRY